MGKRKDEMEKRNDASQKGEVVLSIVRTGLHGSS